MYWLGAALPAFATGPHDANSALDSHTRSPSYVVMLAGEKNALARALTASFIFGFLSEALAFAWWLFAWPFVPVVCILVAALWAAPGFAARSEQNQKGFDIMARSLCFCAICRPFSVAVCSRLIDPRLPSMCGGFVGRPRGCWLPARPFVVRKADLAGSQGLGRIVCWLSSVVARLVRLARHL